MKRKTGFWALGGLLLAGLLLSCLEFFVLERRYQAAKAEYEAMGRQMYEIGVGQSDGEAVDLDDFFRIEHEYWEARRVRYLRGHRPESGITVCGIGLILWLLTLLSRVAVRAAKWSVEREKRREREKDPWE